MKSKLLERNRKRDGLEYCGKFRNFFYGWCGVSRVCLFRKDREVFICQVCLIKNLRNIKKETSK